MSQGPRRIHPSILLIGALFTIGAVLRLILLDADPAYNEWYGAVLDEGRWTAASREWALFGSADLGAHFTRLHLVLAPAFQAATAVFFKIFGVGFGSARLVSSVGGIAMLAAAILFLRKHFSTEGLALVALTLAIQPDLLFLSRLAVPEAAAMLFELLAFALLLSRPWSTRRAFGAGLVTAVLLAVKATTAPVVPALAASAAVIDRVEGRGWGIRRVGAYALGLAVPALLALPVVLWLRGSGGELQLADTVASFMRRLELDSVYGMLSTPFTASYAPALYTLLLPAWILAGVFVSAGDAPDHPARAVYWASAAWALGWLIPSVVLNYFPHRYTQHAFVPLAINVGAGITLVRARGLEKISAALGGGGGIRRAVANAWLAVPAAVLLGSLLLTLAGLAGLDEARLRVQLPTVLLLALVVGGAMGSRRGRSAAFWVIALPLAFAPLWFVGTRAGVVPGEFWDIGASDAAWKLALLAIAAGAVTLIRRSRSRERPLRGWGYAYALLVAGLWLTEIGPRYLHPTFATAQAAAAVEQMVDESDVVGSSFASSVFLGTRLRYTERLHDPTTWPDVVVSAYLPLDEPLEQAFELVAEYEIPGMTCVDLGCVPGWEPSVKIYRRNP